MLNEKWLFFRKFLQKGTQIASFAPSTKAIAKACCRYIDPAVPQIILELGSGTGAVTEVALQKMHPKSTLIAVEADNEFAHFLKQRCPRALILSCKAEEVVEKLATMQIHKVDVIINTLPTPSLPPEVISLILKNCKTLMGDKQIPISQITLMPWIYFSLYKRYFANVKFEMVWNSLPPGGIYHCFGLQQDF